MKWGDRRVCGLTKVPSGPEDPRATSSSPGSWRPRISPVATRWTVAQVVGRFCPWYPYTPRGRRSARSPRCPPLYFRYRSGCPCRAAHCSLREKKKERRRGLINEIRACWRIIFDAAAGKVEPRASSCHFLSLACRVVGRNVCNFRWKNLYVYFCGEIAPAAFNEYGFINLSLWWAAGSQFRLKELTLRATSFARGWFRTWGMRESPIL